MNDRFKPRSENMKRVSVDDIMPNRPKLDERTVKSRALSEETGTGVDKAITRYVNQLIQPQKDLIVNKLIDLQISDKSPNAADIYAVLSDYGDRITDRLAIAYRGFDLVRAQEELRETLEKQKQIIASGGKIEIIDNDDFMKGEDDIFAEADNTAKRLKQQDLYQKAIDIDDMFQDQLYVPPKTDESLKEVDNNKDDDSITIDPSMLL